MIGRGKGKKGGRVDPNTPRRQTRSTTNAEPEIENRDHVEVNEPVVEPQMQSAIDTYVAKDDNDLYEYESDDSYEVRPVRKGRKGSSCKAFKDGSPPKFYGTKDTTVTHKWIRQIEAVIKISECRDDQKVKYATHSFVSEVLCWSKNLVIAMGEKAIDRMSWEELKILLIEEFCPDNEMDKLVRDFLRLEAGSMTHREYTTKFNTMARSQGQKKKNDGGWKKRITTSGITTCTTCGKNHAEECRLKSSICFKCGKAGHLALNCPIKPKCFKCGESGHRMLECPTLKINNPEPLKAKEGEASKAKSRSYTLTTQEAKTLPNVVSEELSRIPPEREVEFRIDLVPGAKPVA
ncbi:hypothetical protein L1987_02365 [Smallanthus sonchifolius]|uniref:Uncharacterized protein n=1 Tax=Smallanthus sonchifolius TaxID=185202 RepID=A0ACB9K7N2_9ASTR|nr:hypothetical protein L1987_02365 [Smallanthus sonchifolius]